MSSNDFDGSQYRPEGGRGADGQEAGGGARYPAPEGWENDGFWRDSSVDANYDTGVQNPVPPASSAHREDPGYSYWSDGSGWQNSPGGSTPPGGHPAPAANAWPGQPADPGPYGPGAGAGAGGYGGGFTPQGPGVPGGYGGGPAGPVNPGGPGGPGWTGGPGVPGGPGGPGRPGGPRGPQGRPGKRKGSWWRHWTWKKALAVTGGIAVFFVLCLFGVYQYMASSATIPAALASANYQNTTIYYSDGKTVLGTIGQVNRQDLTFNEIPRNLQDAVIAAEDRSFWTEGGISPTGILRAAYDDVTGGGGSLSGGSTLTQQFVKNYYDGVGVQQTVSRKVKEIFIAQKLSKTKSKQWILTNYANLIYLGENSYGVAAAAKTYFGKPVTQLSVAQDAVIAAIIQQPSNYPLPAYRSDLVARWHYVLNGMVKTNDLTQAQADSMKFPTLLTDKAGAASGGASITANTSDPWAPYILSVVENELTGPDKVSQQQLETGGLTVVTTISHSMESQLYKAVDANIAAIKATPGAEFPSYIRIGAELQDPKNGQILAMYPGPGQSMSVAECKKLDCDLNTAVYSREQVGSSFKPYVLSAAVADGMNVKTSTLNANPYLCVPPDSPVTSQMALSKPNVVFNGNGDNATLSCPSSESSYFAVENDGGEVIGDPKKGGGTNVQNALAQSSNTAFTDLTHRVTTSNVIKMAENFGVNIATYPAGSGLTDKLGQVGLALGTASLTVNEQTTMLSSIANNGVYNQAHVIAYWQSPDGPKKTPVIESHGVLDPANPANNAQLDSQVQYAMEMTTVNGTGTAAAYGLGNRQIIAKTGTTTSSKAGFFIGAIPQYSLVVGMFTQNQSPNSTESLVPLSGGGFGGYWPAKIWNTFAQAEFANLPTENFQNPVFSGATWNQIGKIAKPKPTVTCVVNGQKKKINGKACPTPTPTPTPTPACSYPGQQNCTTGAGGGTPTPTCSYSGEQFVDGCSTSTDTATPSPTCSYQGQQNCATPGTGGTTPSPSPTCQFPGDPTCTSSSTGQGNGTAAATAGSTKAGLAAGGLAVLPGPLLWASASRRRRRRRAASSR